jgi:hypothetical protein
MAGFAQRHNGVIGGGSQHHEQKVRSVLKYVRINAATSGRVRTARQSAVMLARLRGDIERQYAGLDMKRKQYQHRLALL